MYHLRDTATYLKNKKLLLSLAVLAGAVFLVFMGVWIEGKITDGAEQKARMYQTAIQTKSDNEFNYSIDTKQGRILAEVTVKAVDLVKFPEMNKEFAKVEKTEERYTRHERTVCETEYRTETRTRTVYDSDGNASTETYTVEVPYQECHQETYYSWDFQERWVESAKEVDMAGRKYQIGAFHLQMNSKDAKDIIPGATGKYTRKEADQIWDINFFDSDDEGDIRYSYDVLELPKSGTVFLNVAEGVYPAEGSAIVLRSEKPEELVKNAQKSAQTQGTVFTVFWTILVIIELGVGVYFVWFYEEY